MRYRRLLSHIKAQNWFAVCLDFIIVVFGILIAFQITESSGARKEQIELGRALDNVAQEILETISASEQHITFSQRTIDSLLFTLDVLDNNRSVNASEMKKICSGLTIQPFPPPTNYKITTLLELQNSGKLKDIKPDALGKELKMWLGIMQISEPFREALFRGVQLPDIPIELVSWELYTQEGEDAAIPAITHLNINAARQSQAFRVRLMQIIRLYQNKKRMEEALVFSGTQLLTLLKAQGYEPSDSRYLKLQEAFSALPNKPD